MYLKTAMISISRYIFQIQDDDDDKIKYFFKKNSKLKNLKELDLVVSVVNQLVHLDRSTYSRRCCIFLKLFILMTVKKEVATL